MSIPPAVLETFNEWHAMIGPAYTFQRSKEKVACYDVALSMARAILHTAQRPSTLLTLAAKDGGLLMTKPYGSTVTWYRHVICVADQIAYDPALKQPLPYPRHLKEMFVSPHEIIKRDTFRFG